jgi:hypothetical protein
VVSFTLRPLYPQGKSLWYPLDRRLTEKEIRQREEGNRNKEEMENE